MVLLKKVKFVYINKLLFGSLCVRLSIKSRSSELTFAVLLLLFKSPHVSRAPSDPMTSVVFKKAFQMKVKHSLLSHQLNVKRLLGIKW